MVGDNRILKSVDCVKIVIRVKSDGKVHIVQSHWWKMFGLYIGKCFSRNLLHSSTYLHVHKK